MKESEDKGTHNLNSTMKLKFSSTANSFLNKGTEMINTNDLYIYNKGHKECPQIQSLKVSQ